MRAVESRIFVVFLCEQLLGVSWSLHYSFVNTDNYFKQTEYAVILPSNEQHDVILSSDMDKNRALEAKPNQTSLKMPEDPCSLSRGYMVLGTQPDYFMDNTTNILLVNDSTAKENPPTGPHAQVYYSLMFAVVAVALSSIIFVFGILGNVLVVIVIARTRSMHTTTNCYLLSLAVADSLVLLSATLPAIPEPFFRIDEWPYGRVLCSLLIFFQYLGIDTSSLSITAFTIERYIAICHPMKAQVICTVSRAKRIIAALWTFTILYCSPWLGLTVITETRFHNHTPIQKCQFRLARSSYLVFFVFDLVLMYFIPLLVATVLYLLIGRILYLSRNLRRIEKVTANRGSLQHRVSPRADSRTQVVRMLIVVVVTFASLWMPYRVMVVYNSFAKKKYLDLWFLLFARTMVYANCAINPVLYNIMSIKFRRAFQKYLTCWRRGWTASSHLSSEVPTDVLASQRTRFWHANSSTQLASGSACSSSSRQLKQLDSGSGCSSSSRQLKQLGSGSGCSSSSRQLKQLGSGSGCSSSSQQLKQTLEDIQIRPLSGTRMQFYDSCATTTATRIVYRHGCSDSRVDDQEV